MARRALNHLGRRCYPRAVKQIAAAELKAHCLSILDRIGPDGIVITKRGKPVAKLIPIRTDSANLIGSLRCKIKIKGDILSTGVTRDPKLRASRIVPLLPARG